MLLSQGELLYLIKCPEQEEVLTFLQSTLIMVFYTTWVTQKYTMNESHSDYLTVYFQQLG